MFTMLDLGTATARVYLVYLMNMQQSRSAANFQIKPIRLTPDMPK